MTFDAMAVAVDWLDAYRAADLDTILGMYADDAVVECGCDGSKVISGPEGLRAYWQRRLADYPASHLDDLQPSGDGATISYVARNGVVSATLRVNREGRITVLRCGPRRT